MLFIKHVHFVVSTTNFIRNAGFPGFDLVEMLFLLIISTLADVDGHFLLVNPLRPTPRVSGEEHDIALSKYLIDMVVSILSSLDNFMFIKLLFGPMNSLFWAVVPASIDPNLIVSIFPCAKDLGDGRFVRIIRVDNMNPITFANQYDTISALD